MKVTKRLLIETRFSFLDKNEKEQEDIYNLFKNSYEQTLGTSWDEGKFRSRAKNWLFFGDENGYIAVRVQNSGLYKLVGVAGSIKSIYKGLEELLSLGVPVWGMVSSDIQKMMLKKGFKTPPSFLLKILLKTIPKETFGGVDFDVNSDGSVTLKYSDVGDAIKYFIGNDEYFKSIKKNILPTLKDKFSNIPTLARKGIEMFLGENEQVLDEKITSGDVIVYHRTGKGGVSPVEGISSDGYRVGVGDTYGVGVYTTYTLESQLNDRMSKTYGNIIIESKILSMDKFLIFDYDVAKRIYGNKNYTLDKQLKLILGKEWNKYKDNPTLKELISNIGMTKYTSDVAKPFFNSFIDTIIPKLKGIVFTGSNDGNVLVSYDRTNIEPIRYTTNEGETWTNILNKNIYKRTKGYNPEETNMELQHILNKIVVGRFISYEQFELLTPDQRLEYNKKSFQYAMKMAEELYDIPIDLFKLLTPKQQNHYAMKVAIMGGFIPTDQFELLTPEHRFQYAMKWAEKKFPIPTNQFELLTPEQRFQVVMKIVESGGYILNHDFEMLTPEQQKIYRFQHAMKRAEKGDKISNEELELLTPEQRSQYRIKIAQKNDFIPYEQLKLLPQEDRLEIFMILYPNEVSSKKFELLTPEQQKIYKDKGGRVY